MENPRRNTIGSLGMTITPERQHLPCASQVPRVPGDRKPLQSNPEPDLESRSRGRFLLRLIEILGAVIAVQSWECP